MFIPMKLNFTHRLVFWLVLILIVLLASACGMETPAPGGNVTATVGATEAANLTSSPPSPQTTSTAADDSGGTTADDVAAAVASRTPVPSPTPGIVDREIDDLTTSLGLSGKTFLGLTADDWFSLAFSALIVVVGYFLGFKLLVWILRWIAHRTSRQLNENILKQLEPDLKLLLLVFFTRFAVLRLDFLSDGLRTAFDDVFYLLILVLISIVAIQFINYSLHTYKAAESEKGDQSRLDPPLKVVQRVSDLVVLIIASSFALAHFGIGTSALAAALLVFAVVIYLGAKDIVPDVMAGFIILLDQPFRVGDAILIKHLNTWGTVLQIGTRTTRIRTADNREVIIPNSDINDSQVVNYTYPDSRYRVVTDIGIAYGSDLDLMHKVIEQAVSGVEGVLSDKPVDIFFLKFGDSARLVRVQWWIDSYKNENPILDSINAALEVALDKAGIDMPYDTYDINVKMEDENINQAVQDTNEDSQGDTN